MSAARSSARLGPKRAAPDGRPGPELQHHIPGRLWRIDYELPPDPSTGKRRRTTRRGFATKREAERALRDVLGRIDTGSHVDHSAQSVADYLTTWLAGIRVKPSTRAGYQQSIQLHLVQVKTPGGRPRPGIVGHRLQALDRRPPRRAVPLAGARGRQRRRAAPQRRHPRQGPAEAAGAQTVRHVHTSIRKALQDAVERGYVMRNVADLANPPTQRQARSRSAHDVWTAEQLARFLAAARGHRLYAAFHLLATTGVRRAELCGLRWDAVDLEAGVLRVRWTLVMVGGVLVEQDATKTDAGERTIALDPENRRRAARAPPSPTSRSASSSGRRGRTGPAGCSRPRWGSRSAPTPSCAPCRTWRACRGSAQADRPRPQTRLRDRGTARRPVSKPEVLSKRLGHASVAITMDIYRHVQEGEDAEAAALAARAILG